jgi:hypothetical protein
MMRRLAAGLLIALLAATRADATSPGESGTLKNGWQLNFVYSGVVYFDATRENGVMLVYRVEPPVQLDRLRMHDPAYRQPLNNYTEEVCATFGPAEIGQIRKENRTTELHYVAVQLKFHS